MIRKADTLGTFQIESRAQMAMLPRLKPRTFYDLVIEVAIVRPGPIQGDMVHPYLRRREGKEEVIYPRPELEKVLGKTLGVPLFQEQAMRVAIECAGFTPGEADQLRRAMATFKFTGGVSAFADKLVNGMVARGYTEEFARKTFTQLEGFGSYGFPESHAASFALIAYASSWLKCWHPDVFCAALLNAQPMGFYEPSSIVRDAREHGVDVRAVDINLSRWDCTLEPTDKDGRFAVRLGFRLVTGFRDAEAAALVSGRNNQPFLDVEDAWRRSSVQVSSLVRLAEADAFSGSIGLARRDALWAIKALRDNPLPLFVASEDRAPVPEVNEIVVRLKAMTAGHEVVEDYAHVGLTLRAHPVSFLRAALLSKNVLSCADANASGEGRRMKVAGLVLVRQRPGSAKGVMFITIEDETGVSNSVIWPSVYEQNRRIIHAAHMLLIEAKVQREGQVVHLVVEKLTDMSAELKAISEEDTPFPLRHGRGDEFHHGSGGDARERTAARARDIYIPDLHIDNLKMKPRNFR
jgi:error-prone DNA polymerase